MANLKELRNRITSIGSTMQITSAMKMVSAAKLKKAQDAIQQLRPYANKLREILVNISGSIAEGGSPFSEERDVKTVMLVAITSNRGLCGAFNANVVKLTKKTAEAYKKEGRDVKIIVIGKKAFDGLKSSGFTIVANHSSVYEEINFARVSEVAEWIMSEFAIGVVDSVEVLYNQFKNAGVQIPTKEAFLPIKVESDAAQMSHVKDYLFEPSRAEILEDLIPTTLRTQLFKSVLDSIASEHGARMTAMHKATDNAKDLQKGLMLDYNKARQAAITNEILEIVGGAEALKG